MCRAIIKVFVQSQSRMAFTNKGAGFVSKEREKERKEPEKREEKAQRQTDSLSLSLVQSLRATNGARKEENNMLDSCVIKP